MVLVSYKYKFIYIKNVKVAGSSVESFFGQFCINPEKKYNFNDAITQSIDDYGIIGSRSSGVKLNDIWKNHKDALSIKTDLGDDKFNEYFKFCVIRNPYDAIVSLYFWEKSTEKFKDYAKKKIINNLDRCSIDGKSICDYYIKYENLLEDIVNVCKILKIDKYDINNLPKHKTKIRVKDIHYRDYYDEETRKKVYENHKKIFDKFDYKF
jgi:hypothetical protein